MFSLFSATETGAPLSATPPVKEDTAESHCETKLGAPVLLGSITRKDLKRARDAGVTLITPSASGPGAGLRGLVSRKSKSTRPLPKGESTTRGKGASSSRRGSNRATKRGRTERAIFLTWNANAQVMPNRLLPRLDDKPYPVVQEIYTAAAIASSTSVESFAGFQFNVNALPQITTLTSLFDQYRITKVEFWLIPNGVAAAVTGLIASVIDYDDATSLTTFNQALEYQNVLSTQPDTGHYRAFVPHVALAAYSGTFTSFANEPSPWIDAASPSVQHYGIKTAFTVTSSIASYSTIYRLHTEWRNLR